MSGRSISFHICSATTPTETEQCKTAASMTELRGLVAWVALTVLSTTLIAAPERISRRTRVSEQEPFHSFRILDGKMTLLAHQHDALKSAVNPGQTRSRRKAGIPRRPARAARRMNSTAAGIGRIAAKLEVL